MTSTKKAENPRPRNSIQQAPSSQRVLLGGANITKEYATKRYRSNCINWGMIPFITRDEQSFTDDDYIFVPNIRKALEGDMTNIPAYVMGENTKSITLAIEPLTDEEKEIIRCGSLINYNRKKKQA